MPAGTRIFATHPTTPLIDGDEYFGLVYGFDNSTWYIDIKHQGEGGCNGTFHNAPLLTGKWNHLAFVYKQGASNGEQYQFYLNSKKIPKVIDAMCIDSPPLNDSAVFGTVNLKGNAGTAIDEVRLYDSSLTISEIEKHYADGLYKRQLADLLKNPLIK